MASTCFLIFKFSCPFTNHLGIVPSTPITTDITVTIMLHRVFNSPARSRYFSLFFLLSFNFILWSARFSLLLLTIIGLVIWPKFGWLVGWFYGVSTFVVYLMPNPFICKKKTVLFQRIRLSINTQFNCQKISFSSYLI